MKTQQILFVLGLGGLAACGEVVAPGSGGDASPQPTATSVSPDHGTMLGGIEVEVSGTGFDGTEGGDVGVTVGGLLSPDVTAAGDTVTFELPPGIVEGVPLDVVVFNQNGYATLAEAFTYNPRPVVIGVDPPLAKRAGSTTITIFGRGFEDLEAGDPTITIRGVEAVGVTVVDDETITILNDADPIAPPLAPQDLVVSNANGSDTLVGGIRLTAPGLLAMDAGANRGGPGKVYYVDTSDGTVTPFLTLGARLHECAVNSAGSIFGVAGSSGSGQHLLSVDLLTGGETDLGLIRTTTPQRLTGMAFVGSTLYGIVYPDQRLATINTTTGQATVVNAAGTVIGRGTGIAVRDGSSLYFLDFLNQTLDSIPIATGVVTAGPSVAGTSANSVAAVTVVGSTLFVMERFNPNRIFSVNTTTGALTLVATMPFVADGICPTPPSF